MAYHRRAGDLPPKRPARHVGDRKAVVVNAFRPLEPACARNCARRRTAA
jgi:hypothetical protein